MNHNLINQTESGTIKVGSWRHSFKNSCISWGEHKIFFNLIYSGFFYMTFSGGHSGNTSWQMLKERKSNEKCQKLQKIRLIFLVTLANGFVSFGIYYHFLCKMFTNFSPIRHVNDVKGTYFVKKINIYLIKNSFVFTSRGPRIFGFISSAAHFSNLVVTK